MMQGGRMPGGLAVGERHIWTRCDGSDERARVAMRKEMRFAYGQTKGDWEDQDNMGQKSDIDRDGRPSFATNSAWGGGCLMARDGPVCRLFKR